MTAFSSSAQAFIPEIRIDLRPVLVGLLILGALTGVMGGTPQRIDYALPIALSLLGLAGLGWLTSQWRPTLGKVIIVLGLIVLVLGVHFWWLLPGSLSLLAVPVVLAGAMLGNRWGLLFALTASTMLGLGWYTNQISTGETILALTILWMLFMILWLMAHTVQNLIEWSWSHYTRTQVALDEVRESRGELHQTLEDLAAANHQLGLMNRRLAAAQLAAEEARKAKAAFVANVSHEFRTPLNMIIGLADLLAETPYLYGMSLPANLLEDLEIVRRNAQHLLSLVNDVLDLSQIEANRLALHRDRVDLAELVDRAVAMVRPLLEKKHLTLNVDLPAKLQPITCDGTRVRQVLVNLLSNAVRHTDIGGVSVSVGHKQGHVIFCVHDTGPGIPPEEAAHIFEPFYRGTFGARRHEEGSGLGLSISKQFIEMHDGKMWLRSEVGVGSEFYFSLPVTPLSLPSAGVERWLLDDWRWRERNEPAHLPSRQSKPRVLICDANPDLCEAFRRFNDRVEYIHLPTLDSLTRSNEWASVQMLVINAASPRLLLESVESARQAWPDLVVLGCCLPPKMGQALAAGAQGQILKPITKQGLEAIVRAVQPTPQRVLVVDDDADARRLFTRMLTAISPGLEADMAEDGEEALQKMRDFAPDLVLLDIMLPKLDGWGVLAEKQKDQRLRSIPTYLLSAQDPDNDPFTSPVLLAALGERTPFAKLLQCSEIIPAILRQPTA